MTEDELIAAERRAVDSVTFGYTAAQRKRLYAKMRAFSRLARNGPLPNDVNLEDACMQLTLRARDLAGHTDEPDWYLTPAERAA